MANGPLILDLMHPVDTILQFPTAGRVGDAGIKIPLWIKQDGKPYDLTGYEVGLYGNDAQGMPKIVHQDPTGTSVQSGNILFTLPGELFRAAGKWKECFFKVLKDGEVVSTVSVGFNVLENNVEFNLPDEPFVSDFAKWKQQFGDAMIDWDKLVTDLITSSNADLSDIFNKIKTINDTLTGIKQQIDSGNVATKADIDSEIQGALLNLDKKYIKSNAGLVGPDTDWNTLTTTGVYSVSGAKGTNCPTDTTATWGDLFVLANSDKWLEQHYFSATTNGTEFVRSYSGNPGKWDKWEKVPKQSEIDLITQQLNDAKENELKVMTLPRINGASKDSELYIVNGNVAILNIDNGLFPKANGIMYQVPVEYTPMEAVGVTQIRNSTENITPVVMRVETAGAVRMLGNLNDTSGIYGFAVWAINKEKA